MYLYHWHLFWQRSPRASGTLHSYRGVSLIMVLVSLALSMLLLISALYWYQVLKGSLIADRKKRQALDIGRTSLHFLSQDLNAAGYRGCRSRDLNFPIRRAVVDFKSSYRFIRTDRSVFGFFAAPGFCTLYLPAKACERLKENSDVLLIYNIPKKRSFLKQDMQETEEIIVTEDKSGIQTGSVILLWDSLQADLVVATEVDNEKIHHQRSPSLNVTSKLSKCYAKKAEVTELQTVAYYLAAPKRAAGAKTTFFSLYRDDILHQAVEVLEGITEFEIRYGVLESGKALDYQKAEDIALEDWSRVSGVQIKIKTETAGWQYEIALRNRPYFN